MVFVWRFARNLGELHPGQRKLSGEKALCVLQLVRSEHRPARRITMDPVAGVGGVGRQPASGTWVRTPCVH